MRDLKTEISKFTAGQKAAHTRKWRRASDLAHRSAQNAKTFTKYELSKKGYKCISFDTPKGYEYKGVVDLIAAKRSTKNPDRLQIILLQVKGGKARITSDEISRLRAAAKHVKIGWNVVQKPGRTVRFRKRIPEGEFE